MKVEFVEQLRCPVCGNDHVLRLHAEESDEREVREGVLRCSACASEFPVRRGVPELLHDPPDYILKEIAGLERFADQMRLDGWNRELVRKLPDLEHGYWYVQSRSMYQLLSTIPFRPGQSVLDVGSNTCWAANHFAERGLRPIALDIATVELQGLYTAEYFIDDGHVFFERVLGSMDAIPLASSSVDYVYCCEVLHHNDAAGLRRTLADIFRVLRPGGRLLMVNETLKTLRDRSGMHLQGVEQYEGYEHAHWAMSYRWEATRAGFFTDVTEPHYRAFFGDTKLSLGPETGRVRAVGRRLGFSLRRIGIVRRAYLAWLNHVVGGVSMNMVATKPRRFVGRHERMWTPERLLRTAAAGVRVKVARLGRSPGSAPRLPRSPEQAAAALQAVRRDQTTAGSSS